MFSIVFLFYEKWMSGIKQATYMQTLFKICGYIYLWQTRSLIRLKTVQFQKQSFGGFYKKGAFKNFAKFTIKHLCQSLLFNKVAGPGMQLYWKKETLAQVFSCKLCENFKSTNFYRTPLVTASKVHLINWDS